MSKTTTFSPGFGASVAWLNGRGYLATRTGNPQLPGAVQVFEWHGDTIEQAQMIADYPLGPSSPAFPKLHVFDGTLWLAYQDGVETGHLRNLTGHFSRMLHPCHFNDPICFGSRWCAWQGVGADVERPDVSRLDLESGDVTELGRIGNALGLSRVMADGSVRTMNDDRFLFDGQGGLAPVFSKGLTIASGKHGGVFWIFDDGTDGVLWKGENTPVPGAATEDGQIIVAAAPPAGVRVWIGTRAELIAESVDPPDPPPPPPPPPPPMTPDHSSFVHALNAQVPELLIRNTRADAARFTRLAALRLATEDRDWGLLTKDPGENNVDGYAIDAVIYKATQQVVDIIAGAGDGEATPPKPGRVVWQHTEKRPNNHWHVPVPPDGPIEPQPHVYDGGENDTGICDRCGKPKADPIHVGSPPPPDDKDKEQDQAIAKLRLDLAATAAKAAELERRLNELPPPGEVDVDAIVSEVLQRISKRYRTTDAGPGFLRHSHEVQIP